MQLTRKERYLVNQAIKVSESRAVYTSTYIEGPANTIDLCRPRMSERESEGFGVVFLNSRQRVIKVDLMFEGTINAASVWPREIVKAALQRNASAVILTHNHPSGDSQSSDADVKITRRLQEALGLIDVRVLDHIIIAYDNAYSMAEFGQL